MTSFLSTFVNKVDRKGRVSVPAPFRAALAGQGFQGIVAYPSLTDPAIDVIGRDLLDRMIGRRFDRTLEDGDFERVLLGGDDDQMDRLGRSTLRELVEQAESGGELVWGTTEERATSEKRVGIILALIAASRDYQFA